ncbi:MAG: DUF177 domain-containing protein [Mariprofundus sp.]
MQKQWLITLQGLPAAGRSWNRSVSALVLADAECGEVEVIPDLVADVMWSGEILRTGAVYHLHGHWQTAIRRECSRCTAQFDWQASSDAERDYQLGDERKADSRDVEAMAGVCEYLPAPGELNLLDVLREDIWLTWKADVICAESCKGLCPGCGSDLNVDVCSCKKGMTGHPFAALAKLKLSE